MCLRRPPICAHVATLRPQGDAYAKERELKVEIHGVEKCSWDREHLTLILFLLMLQLFWSCL
jgi:hypothetical protein